MNYIYQTLKRLLSKKLLV